MCLDDAEGLIEARETYGDSWKARGGVGAFMMLCRKWDRIENTLKKETPQYDILAQIAEEVEGGVADGILDDLRDLRRYCGLVEAELIQQGLDLPLQRDNRRSREREQRELD